MTPEDRASLRSLLAAATPRPWCFWHGDDAACMNAYGVTSEPCEHEMTTDEGHAHHVVALTLLQYPRLADIQAADSLDGVGWIRDTTSWRWAENAALIVAAVNALPALLDALEAAESKVETLTGLVRTLDAALQPTGDHHALPDGYCLDCEGGCLRGFAAANSAAISDAALAKPSPFSFRGALEEDPRG